MAHEISSILNSNGDFAYVGEKAWHSLGTELPAFCSAEEMAQAAGHNFLVEKRPSGIFLDGVFHPSEVHWHTYRTDTNTILGAVREQYRVIQNSDLWKFLEELAIGGTVQYQTAGVLRMGEKVFVTAKLPKSWQMPDSEVDNYIVISNTHSGRECLTIFFTPIRVVCANTLRMALKGNNGEGVYKITHTESWRGMLSDAMRALGAINILQENLKDMSIRMLDYTPDYSVEAYLAECIGMKEDATRGKNVLEKAVAFAQTGVGQKGIQDNAWGYYNALTGFFSHVKSYKSAAAQYESFFGPVAADTKAMQYGWSKLAKEMPTFVGMS